MRRHKILLTIFIFLLLMAIGYICFWYNVALYRAKAGSCINHMIQLSGSAGQYMDKFNAPPFIEGDNEFDVFRVFTDSKRPFYFWGCPALQKDREAYNWSKSGYRIRNWPLSEWEKFRDFSYRNGDREYYVPFIWCAEPAHDSYTITMKDRIFGRHKLGRTVLFMQQDKYYLLPDGSRILSSSPPKQPYKIKWRFYSFPSFVDETTFQNICRSITEYKQSEPGMTESTD